MKEYFTACFIKGQISFERDSHKRRRNVLLKTAVEHEQSSLLSHASGKNLLQW